MLKHYLITVSLIDLGSVVEEFQYRPYSHCWWKISTDKENVSFFPLRIGQKTKTCLNNHDFFVTIVVGNKNDIAAPEIGVSSQVNWLNAGPENKSFFMHKFNGDKQAIYVSKIEEDNVFLKFIRITK
ncbi:413_t:CDS:2 [Funneliformis mosseae]|uniref:413_t:CDS:1 n=1 Tax=Funneliformis mosseae TaxID=27381 RepID=A0A9N9E4Q2_FUNMO|nr:413_t:CDS:2 [Funneliformis mosseae]